MKFGTVSERKEGKEKSSFIGIAMIEKKRKEGKRSHNPSHQGYIS